MIAISDLDVWYDSLHALEGVNLCIPQGEFVLFTGPSGCGKSTLARCLNGLIPHALGARLSGQVVIDGRPTTAATVAELSRAVGVVFQNPATQLFNLTVGEEVAFGPRNLDLPPAEVTRRCDEALAAVSLSHLKTRSTRALSGGEQQRLAIASVLAMGPKILVLDEPTASLDVPSTREVMSILARLNAAGVTILVFEHRLGEVARLARRTVLLEEGRIIADGPTDDVFARRDLLLRLGLRRPAAGAQEDWPGLLVPNGHPRENPVVALRGVEAGYGSHAVLQDLDLTLYRGDFAALVGDNGAGKSTLARVLAGLTKPRRGTIELGGRGGRALGRDVGLLFQNPAQQLFCDCVEDEVTFGPRNFDQVDRQDIEAVLAATDLTGLRGRPIQTLSSGQQQRTALAAVLSLRPGLIILDEPTLGQDWRHLSAFMDLLVRLNQAGSTILLITHDYKLVFRYARRILLLQGGRIAADGVPIKI